jgi:cadmium resistance protein CadD (predicted permease)
LRLERKINLLQERQVVQHEKNKSYLSFLPVAAVTFSNGGDNIGVYIPLFSKYNTISEITALAAVFIYNHNHVSEPTLNDYGALMWIS